MHISAWLIDIRSRRSCHVAECTELGGTRVVSSVRHRALLRRWLGPLHGLCRCWRSCAPGGLHSRFLWTATSDHHEDRVPQARKRYCCPSEEGTDMELCIEWQCVHVHICAKMRDDEKEC